MSLPSSLSRDALSRDAMVPHNTCPDRLSVKFEVHRPGSETGMRNPVMERMREFGLRPRKELGQHFLSDGNVLRRLLEVIDPRPNDYIVEYGAGLGVLTEKLLLKGARVVAVELDDALADVLRRSLDGFAHFELQHTDLARLDLERLCRERNLDRIRCVGNLPYQLTSHVLFGMLTLGQRLQDAVFMIQREVAERIVSRPGGKEYGIPSVLLQCYMEVEIAMRVKPGSFTPPPRVDSAVLQITPRPEPGLAWNRSTDFIRLVKNVFNERRKTLRNTLKKFHGLDAVAASRIERAGIDLNRRPESLSVDEFVRLLQEIES